jgi:ArsR family transcriptional regulator
LLHALEAPQPRVSQHLARLRGAGLVGHRRVANRHYYALAADLPDWVARVVDAYRDGFAHTGRLDALRARLATMEARPPRLEAA